MMMIIIIMFHFLNVLVSTGFVLVGQKNNNNIKTGCYSAVVS